MSDAAARTLIVANRLPVTIARSAGGWRVTRSTGGLATGLDGVHSTADSLWIGWPGTTTELEPARRAELDAKLAERRLVPVWVPRSEFAGYYRGIANGLLWPAFHYLLERIPLQIKDWAAYEAVNERFADAVADIYRPGDRVWVHDYHLMLVPDLLRTRVPDARIGFFLHIPFPTSEVFRALPHRERLLEGLLGADLVGFHTASYARHFSACLLRLLGLGAQVDRVQVGDRTVRIAPFPMGIDAAHWENLANADETQAIAAQHRAGCGGALLVGIDRLDYTKGIPRRLLAYERLLADHAELRGKVQLVQVAVPSRGDVGAYRDYGRRIDRLVGNVNGTFGTPQWTPIHYVRRGLDQRQVAALYRAADVMLVTTVRDGMNLVAKEFIACRGDEDGVLLLSEFAGAASELAEALKINPYDVERTAAAIYQGLTLPADERRRRMQALRRRVISYDVGQWATKFLAELDAAATCRLPPAPTLTDAAEVERMIVALRAAPALVLLIDYDGTLVPFADLPELAAPDPELIDLLTSLAARPRTIVHVVSGRARDSLDRLLHGLPTWLHAEHGLWSRPPDGAWKQATLPPLGWVEQARAILEDFRARTPGSLVEEKTAGLAWHFRMADPEFGAHQANELRLHLAELLSNEPVHVLVGQKVIELRPQGIDKGRIVPGAVAGAPTGSAVLALGDDHTDEDLFRALPATGVAVHVGPTPSEAPVRIRDWRASRSLLGRLLG